MPTAVDRAAARIREEFDEMPGLALTPEQAARFLGLEESIARSAVEHLVVTGWLTKGRRGAQIGRAHV